MNADERRQYYQHEKDAIWDALNSSYEPEYGPRTEEFLEDLWENGYVILPRTYVGSAGWTPDELWAFQCGIMHAMHNVNEVLEIEEVPEL